MKKILLAAALAMSIAGPALAQTDHATQHVRHEPGFRDSNASVSKDRYGVYIDGQEVGRDPDPAIRTELYNEHYQLQGR